MAPFACPICSGRGFVSKSFYQHYWQSVTNIDGNYETCRSCNGKGYILADQDKECSKKHCKCVDGNIIITWPPTTEPNSTTTNIPLISNSSV